MASESLQVYAVGDICPGEHYFCFGHGVRTQFEQGTLQRSLDFLRQHFAAADIVIGNLEGVISNSSKHVDPIESRVFRGKPQFALWLKEMQFSHINIANNHIMQHGVDAALESIAALKHAGLTPIGLRHTSSEWACTPQYVNVKGITVGILAYSYVPERYEPLQNIYATGDDQESVLRDIKKLKSEADFVIVSIHGGDEGLLFPSEEYKQICQAARASGADVIIGHHSHTIQNIENNNDSPIFYSLGNFTFDMGWDERFTDIGVAEIKIQCKPRSIAPQIHIFKKTKTGYSKSKKIQKISAENYQNALSKFEIKNQIRKLFFFISNFHRGHVRTKYTFITSKIRKIFKS